MFRPESPPADRFDAWLALTGQVPAPSGPLELPLLTGSMAPAIPAGATLLIAATSGAAVRGGDVAVFREGDRLVAHRVLLVLRAGPVDLVLEKGDANRRGRWRRGRTVCGRVTGFRTPDGAAGGDPHDAVAASNGLRRHLRHLWRRPPPPDTLPEDTL
ncbi:hypothetical protein KDM41_04525 [bacterium]|nr:hypothetical protein [bacterium]